MTGLGGPARDRRLTRTGGLLLAGLLLSLVLAGGASYYASSDPDGLEKVSADQGFAGRAADHPLADSPVADYSVRDLQDTRLSGGLAGVLGVLTTFAIGGLVFAVVRRSPREEAGAGDAAGGADPESGASG
jgi:cobalt/nickel transport system permease protein